MLTMSESDRVFASLNFEHSTMSEGT